MPFLVTYRRLNFNNAQYPCHINLNGYLLIVFCVIRYPSPRLLEKMWIHQFNYIPNNFHPKVANAPCGSLSVALNEYDQVMKTHMFKDIL